MSGPRQFLDDKDKPIQVPHIAVFLYGLVFADLNAKEGAPEALLPAASDHAPKLYAGTIPDDNSGTTVGTSVRWWDIKESTVRFVPADANCVALSLETKPVTKPQRVNHNPWSKHTLVRELRKLTEGDLIDNTTRSKKDYVAARVRLPFVQMEPVPPFSIMGRSATFSAIIKGKAELTSSTDTLLGVIYLPPATKKVLVEIKTFTGNVTTHCYPLNAKQQVVFAVTHSSEEMPENDRPVLDHTRAYGRLIKNYNVCDYPVPTMVNGAYGEIPGDGESATGCAKDGAHQSSTKTRRSSRDGHCEVSWDG